MKLDQFALLGRAASDGVYWGVCELSPTLGRLSDDVWVCIAVLLVVWHGPFRLEPAGSQVELGLGVEMETSGRALAN